MPTKADHPNVIPETKTKGRKHRTKAEIAARKAAARDLERTDALKLTVPETLHGDAKKIAARKIKEIKGLNSPDVLLDALDVDEFSNWCVIQAEFEKLAKMNGSKTQQDLNNMFRLKKLATEGAEKLGFTPASRARLIRKRATENPEEEPGRKFD